MTIIAIMLAFAVSAYWLLKPKEGANARRIRRSANAAQRSGSVHSMYQSASIKPGGCACSAVQALGDKRFLADEVPRMPLPDCDVTRCQCRYVRHEDRRQREDRRAPYCLQTDLHSVAGNKEHRVTACRRQADKLSEAASDLRYEDIEWAT